MTNYKEGPIVDGGKNTLVLPTSMNDFNPTSESDIGIFSYNPMEPEFIHPMDAVEMAFSKPVRRRIWRRDRGMCQDSGRRHVDGWYLDCAHYDHDRDNPNYNEPSNGRLLSLSYHLLDHLNIWADDPTDDNMWAIRLVAKRAFQALRRPEVYVRDVGARVRDQQEVLDILASKRLDPNLILA